MLRITIEGSQGEGKSIIARALQEVLSLAKRRTIVLDDDLGPDPATIAEAEKKGVVVILVKHSFKS